MMQGTPKSSVMTGNTKPNNVFYVWYTELCRRLNSNSASLIRPANPKCNTVLDFVADRLKFEDWSPLLNALRHDTSLHVINIRSRMSNCQFLHEVDTEDKARRMKRKYGALWTDFILNSLIKSLSFSIKKTQVLTCLELDGLPMSDHYLDGLLKALLENRTLKNFSLMNCNIQDAGCRSVCSCLQLLPNVEWLNLSRCDLSPVSGIFLAKLIKFQQLNRYTTSWHNSLRYSEPDSEKMCGIRRVTLNCNLKFGDEGLNYILDELEDDLWVKALDVQKCGITEDISDRILDILQYNRSLKIADFRQNDDLHPCTLEKILDILKEKETNEDYDTEYHWCNSVHSLSPTSIVSTCREVSSFKNKTFVLPPRKTTEKSIKSKTSTMIHIDRKNQNIPCRNSTPSAGPRKKKIEVKLMNTAYDTNRRNSENYETFFKKKDMEKCNNGMKKITNTKLNRRVTMNHTNISDSIIKTFGKLKNSKEHKEAPNNTPADSPTRKKELVSKYLNGVKINGLRNGFKKNGEKPVSKTASSMFEEMISGKPEEKPARAPSKDRESVSSLVEVKEQERNEEFTLDKGDLSDSQVSLFDFMQDLKGGGDQKAMEPKKISLKYHYKEKRNFPYNGFSMFRIK